ncbi:LOW QUALITY PROTEIN: hypothetical protein M513_08647 [Trichuris suis]|uniref:Uncharacterized protein n=1 Tax=Trichuris suis TaxID=68888 RepID=A0A085LZM4_9BILA|nr:LOW QUALITY PROTEIN: hypothetical protein M513_08647 [Trichuris suis]
MLATRIASIIVRELRLKSDSITFWTDSAVVLHWLNTTGRRLCIFVENRVSEILDVTKINQWRFVPGKENPADRGINPGRLKDTHWFSGPAFLGRCPEYWPNKPFENETVTAEELEYIEPARHISVPADAISDDPVLQLITRISRLNRLLRVAAWIHRAKSAFRATRGQYPCPQGALTPAELSKAGVGNLRPSAARLKNNRPIARNSKLRRLNPYMDDTGILRVGGRLHLAHLGLRALTERGQIWPTNPITFPPPVELREGHQPYPSVERLAQLHEISQETPR